MKENSGFKEPMGLYLYASVRRKDSSKKVSKLKPPEQS